MSKIILFILLINKIKNLSWTHEELIRLYANEICSYHGKPKIENNSNISCECQPFYTQLKKNEKKIFSIDVQCYYPRKHRFIVVFFSIFLPFGLDFYYLERYNIFIIVFLFVIFVIINRLICFFISNKFKGENIQESQQQKEKKDKNEIKEEEKEDTSGDFLEFEELNEINKNKNQNSCHKLYKTINFILTIIAVILWILDIIFHSLGKISDSNGIKTVNDLYYLFKYK